MRHSLEWVECKRKIFLLDRAPRCLFFFSSHVRLLLEVGTLSIKCSKTLYFRKSAVKLISFRLKTYQVYSGNVFRLDAIGYCVFQKSAALIFVLRKAFFRAYTIWKAIIMVNELIEWSAICELVWNHTRDFSSIWNHKSVLSDQNCTPLSSITTLLQPFWNCRIQSVI